MQIKDSKFHKVWKIEENNGLKFIDLGDSKKEKDGSYTNWTWFKCMLVGNAKNVELAEGDTVTVVSGLVQKRKYNDKYYDNVVIFDIEVTKKGEVTPSQDDFTKMDPGEEIPF